MAKVPVFKATNLSKKYMLGEIEVQALQSVNIEIYSGEFICFFGPSGCGKSTLLSLIAGLQQPTTGEIYVRGEKLSVLDKNGLAKYRRSKIGMVFQSFNLIHSMNVIENIALPLSFGGISKSKRMKRAEDLLAVVGLQKYKTHTPAQLSGGQQQRVAIARSLVNAPWIMLADEPTGNLDSKSANEVMRLLISLNRKSKRTVILITHNPEYLDYADRIFYMQDGKVVKTTVNSKVKTADDVVQVGKIRDDLDPSKIKADDQTDETADDAAIVDPEISADDVATEDTTAQEMASTEESLDEQESLEPVEPTEKKIKSKKGK